MLIRVDWYRGTDAPEERITSIFSAHQSEVAGLLDSGNEAKSPCERSVALYQSAMGKIPEEWNVYTLRIYRVSVDKFGRT